MTTLSNTYIIILCIDCRCQYSVTFHQTHLNSCQVLSEGDVGLLHVGGPGREEGMTEVLVKVAGIGHEGRGEHHVSADGTHLALEGLAASLPSLLLIGQATQEGLAALNLQWTHALTLT